MSHIQNTYRAIVAPYVCRTVMLQLIPEETDTVVEEVARISSYMLAYESDPLLGLWTVQEVDVQSSGEEMPIYTPEDRQNIDFKDAMNILARFERKLDIEENGQKKYERIGDTPKKMGKLHFKTYAMMNGLIPDNSGRMHKRPHELALPNNCTIKKTDLELANKLWEDADLSRHNSPFVGFQQTETLSEQFARLSRPGIDAHGIINRTVEKRIDVLERFMSRLETCYKNLVRYENEFRELGRIEYIEAAEAALMEAREMIEKKGVISTKSEFKDVDMPYTNEFKTFVDYEAVKIIVMHVQALQTINNEQRFDTRTSSDKEEQFEKNSEDIEKRLKEAEKYYRAKVGASDTDIRNMRNVATSLPPAVSPELANIAKDFSARKKAWFENAQKGERLRDDSIIPAIIKEQAAKAIKEKTADFEKKTGHSLKKPAA